MDCIVHAANSNCGVRLDDVDGREGRKMIVRKYEGLFIGCLIGACYAAVIIIAFIEK